ncbi:hypothetical protein OIU84_016402 [Salix udensis]|uniref:Uncharacterized protein n=1 Tax=Salix udensis TaxID=889485 RepID=A0AAD6NQQ4_9ROSI|nr:hypothetical protein OIU84_016402 [Salix udensis]
MMKSLRSLKLKRRNQNSLDISFVLCSKLKIYPGQNIPGIKRRWLCCLTFCSHRIAFSHLVETICDDNCGCLVPH